MSVEQLKDGRWLCRYPRGKDTDRPESTKRYFQRGVEGESQAIAYNESLGLGTRVKAQRSPLFSELINTYWMAKKHTMRPSTLKNFQTIVRAKIAPALGQYQIHQITPERLDQYVSERAQSVQLNSIFREITLIRAVIRFALSRRLIASNPIELFKMSPPPDARIAPPTESEFRAILACASQHLQRAMLITWYTGLRPGPEELNFARWSAVDFERKTFTVFSADKGGLPVRNVPLCQPILDHLGKWYADNQPKGDDYIITHFGRPVRRMERSWIAAKRRAGITRRLRLYDMRHAFITTLLERGADLRSVSEIVGHASPDLTMRIYQHVSSDLKRSAVDLLS